MLHEMRKISKLAVVLFLGWNLVGCSEAPTKDPPIKEPEARVFPESYEKVWRSVQLAMKLYPIRVDSLESGILETDFVKDDKVFSDPNYPQSRRGFRYKVVVRVVRGSLGGKGATKVTVIKNGEIQTD